MTQIDSLATFQATVWEYYHVHGRTLPWRTSKTTSKPPNPYHVMISEYMLQQTQVPRVIPKFQQFITLFPTVEALAAASLHEVLKVWTGLGYNRRAKYVHAAAKEIVTVYGGKMPKSLTCLEALPGIGRNTAAAIVAYSFNRPVIFVETNIRTVYIHHFFAEQEAVSDQEILAMVQATLDQTNPREWYWALMDYGTFLKTKYPNMHRKSSHYKKQSPFDGSKRQIRGEVIRLLATKPRTHEELHHKITDSRLGVVLDDLQKESLIAYSNSLYTLAGE